MMFFGCFPNDFGKLLSGCFGPPHQGGAAGLGVCRSQADNSYRWHQKSLSRVQVYPTGKMSSYLGKMKAGDSILVLEAHWRLEAVVKVKSLFFASTSTGPRSRPVATVDPQEYPAEQQLESSEYLQLLFGRGEAASS